MNPYWEVNSSVPAQSFTQSFTDALSDPNQMMALRQGIRNSAAVAPPPNNKGGSPIGMAGMALRQMMFGGATPGVTGVNQFASPAAGAWKGGGGGMKPVIPPGGGGYPPGGGGYPPGGGGYPPGAGGGAFGRGGYPPVDPALEAAREKAAGPRGLSDTYYGYGGAVNPVTAEGPVPGVRYCDRVPGARNSDGSEVCIPFPPSDPRRQWRPRFEGERPPWDPYAEWGTPRDLMGYDNTGGRVHGGGPITQAARWARHHGINQDMDPWAGQRDYGYAQAVEEQRKKDWDVRIKKELCGPQLKGYKIPPDAADQMKKYGRSFEYLIRQLGSSSPQEVDKARATLVSIVKNNPPRQYTPPVALYKECKKYQPDKQNEAYLKWSRECAKDPSCKKKREDLGKDCKRAKDSLPADDPRGTKWQKANQNKSSAALAAAKEELRAAGWQLDRNKGEWTHPNRQALTACRGTKQIWLENGANPRLWMSGKVEGSPKWPEGHPRAGQPKYAQDIHSIPSDRECRFKSNIKFEADFIAKNFYNEDGTPRSYEELLTERVITRDMLTCPINYGQCRLKNNARPELSAEVLDKYLKNEDGSWKTNADKTRRTTRDVIPQLIEDGLIPEDQVECPKDRNPVNDAQGFTLTASVPSQPVAPPPAEEADQVVHVAGSPIPFYGSFKPQGLDAIFSPSPQGEGTPLSVVGGVRAFPDQVRSTPRAADEPPPALAEGLPARGAASIWDFTVSFMDGAETWPAIS